MIVRYMYVESYMNGDDTGIEMYKKMQFKRRGEYKDFVTRFNANIQSFKKNGYKKYSYILTNRHLFLRDGSHRLAMSMYFGNDITCLVQDHDMHFGYELNWFNENDFTSDEIAAITATKDRIWDKCNQPINIVLSGASIENIDDIADMVEKYGQCHIRHSRTYKNKPCAVISLQMDRPSVRYDVSIKSPYITQLRELSEEIKTTFGENIFDKISIPANFMENRNFAAVTFEKETVSI